MKGRITAVWLVGLLIAAMRGELARAQASSASQDIQVYVGELFGVSRWVTIPLTTVFLAAAIPSLVGSGAIFLMGRTQISIKNAKGALGVAAS